MELEAEDVFVLNTTVEGLNVMGKVEVGILVVLLEECVEDIEVTVDNAVVLEVTVDNEVVLDATVGSDIVTCLVLIVRDADELDTAANELVVMEKAESVVEDTNASEASVSTTSEVVIILLVLLEECVEATSSSIDIEDVLTAT